MSITPPNKPIVGGGAAGGGGGAHNHLGEVNCTRAMQQLWDFLDQELTDEQMGAVRRHVESCSSCFPHKDWAEHFLEALHSMREERIMPTELKVRVIAQLRAAGFVGTQ